MIANTSAHAMAANIWDSLPGNYTAKVRALAGLFVELERIREAAKPPLTTRGTIDVDSIIDRSIGRSLRAAEGLNVPLNGVPVSLATIFRTAQEPDHPFAAASAAFLNQHGLYLATVTTGRRRKARIARKAPSVAAVELARLKATLADRAALIDATRNLAASAIGIAQGAEHAGTATDHSGGVTSTIQIERGDD